MDEIIGSAANSSCSPTPVENELIEVEGASATPTTTLTEEYSEKETEEKAEEENHYTKKQRKKTSPVWNEFKLVELPNGTKRHECVHCKQRLSAIESGTTSHLLRHLRSCTRRQIAMKGQKKLSVSTSLAKLESVGAVQNFQYSAAKVREVFSHMILVHELPFNFAEYKIFNLLMKTACPEWEKISRATLRKDCFSSFELQKKMIHDLLMGANRVSITTDLWTSDQKVQYMVVTSHFVDADLRLQKRTLNFVDVPPPHTGLVISDALHKCLVQWGIDKKVWTVTVDNASYNDVAVNNLKGTLEYASNLPLEGKFFHVRCCAHILNILVQFGLTKITHVINNVRESVKHIIASTPRLQMFSDIVKNLKLHKKKLILDCGTRWNATYAMLVVALDYKDVFPRYKLRDQSYKHLPSEEDWEKARGVCSFLEEFEIVTNIISGTEYPTSNLFLPELWHVKKILDDAMFDHDSCVTAMAIKMKAKFDKYWGESNLLISIAAVLDPRNKMKFLHFSYKALYSDVDAPAYLDNVRKSLYKLFQEYVKDHKEKAAERNLHVKNVIESSQSSEVGGKRSRGRKEFDNLMRNVEIIDGDKSELDIYLEEPVTLHNDDLDPPFDALEWWRQRNDKFCILSRMACDVLSIPITSVASESAFSAGGRVIDPHRASLGANTVEMLMCGADWLRAHYGLRDEDVKQAVGVESISKFEFSLL